MAPHFNFQTKQDPAVSVSNIRDLEIIRTRNCTIFTVYAAIFGQFTAPFLFFLTKLDHFTLDLLKRSNT